MTHSATILFAMMLLAANAAQSGADPANGRALAQRLCAECHAVDSSATSPHSDAPAFLAVANAPGRTATSMRVWIQSPHQPMPDFHLGEKDSNDLIAYILSLRRPG